MFTVFIRGVKVSINRDLLQAKFGTNRDKYSIVLTFLCVFLESTELVHFCYTFACKETLPSVGSFIHFT